MKSWMRNLAFAIVMVFSRLLVQAQSAPVKKIGLDENTVVRGEDGIVYPYAIWQKMMMSGKYSIKSRNTSTEAGKPEYLIYEMTEAQKMALYERMPKPRESDSFVAGQKFTGFKATDLNGQKFDFRNATGKVIVLNFWFINCPPCKMEIPDLNALHERYKENNEVVFLAIALDERFDLKDFLKTTPFNYPIVDGGRYLADKYGVKSYPTHVVIDKTGTIKFSTVGLAANTVSWIKKSIEEALIQP